MKREYYIANSEFGYKICREGEEDGIKKQERLQNNGYTSNKEFAKTFYHLSDATSALVIERMRGKRTPTISIKKSESVGVKGKTSWSEL